MNVQSSRTSLPITFWSIREDYRCPYVAVISSSVTRVTHWMSCFKNSSVGPTDRLKFDPGFHRAENSASQFSVARGRW